MLDGGVGVVEGEQSVSGWWRGVTIVGYSEWMGGRGC
jgi:hypothetical protein